MDSFESTADNDWQAAINALVFALEKYPERVAVTPVKNLVMEAAREKSARPAYLKIAVDDDDVKAIRGSEDKAKDMLLLVRIPKDVQERSTSSIILPGEV